PKLNPAAGNDFSGHHQYTWLGDGIFCSSVETLRNSLGSKGVRHSWIRPPTRKVRTTRVADGYLRQSACRSVTGSGNVTLQLSQLIKHFISCLITILGLLLKCSAKESLKRKRQFGATNAGKVRFLFNNRYNHFTER